MSFIRTYSLRGCVLSCALDDTNRPAEHQRLFTLHVDLDTHALRVRPEVYQSRDMYGNNRFETATFSLSLVQDVIDKTLEAIDQDPFFIRRVARDKDCGYCDNSSNCLF